MAELERIKKERAEEARKKVRSPRPAVRPHALRHRLTPGTCAHTMQAVEEEARQAKEKEKELMTGNPLLALAGDVTFSIKHRCG